MCVLRLLYATFTLIFVCCFYLWLSRISVWIWGCLHFVRRIFHVGSVRCHFERILEANMLTVFLVQSCYWNTFLGKMLIALLFNYLAFFWEWCLKNGTLIILFILTVVTYCWFSSGWFWSNDGVGGIFGNDKLMSHVCFLKSTYTRHVFPWIVLPSALKSYSFNFLVHCQKSHFMMII